MNNIQFDEGYSFGLGVFETIWVWKNKPIFLEEHLNRLFRALRALSIRREQTGAEINERIRQHLQRYVIENGVLKIIVSEKNIIITHRENIYKEEDYRKGFSLEYSPIRRNSSSPFTYFKTLNYGDNILAKRAAHLAGYDEPVFLNERGEICEGATTNIFFVSDGKLYTPSLSCGLLNGIIRQYVISQYRVEEIILKPKDISKFDEIFVTNSLLGAMPAAAFSGHKLKSKGVAEEIRKGLSKKICSW